MRIATHECPFLCDSLSGDIDVSRLCDAPLTVGRLKTGEAILVIEVVKSGSLDSYVEAVIENNRYEIPVMVSCSKGKWNSLIYCSIEMLQKISQ